MIDAAIDRAMREFKTDLAKILRRNLLSVILFGSAVLGDFRPGRGDLDFMVVTSDELGKEDCERLFDLHDSLRSGAQGQLAAQLEGTYYPLAIAEDPRNASAGGCYVGTSRNGWRQITSSRNSMSDYAIICRYGIFYGQDIRDKIYCPTSREITDEFSENLDRNIDDIGNDKGIGYALAMFHWAPRGLCHAMTGQLVSKKDAANWFAEVCPDPLWSELVLHAESHRHCVTPAGERELDRRIQEKLGDFLFFARHLLAQMAIPG